MGSEIIDIRRFEASAYSGLLDAESRAWDEALHWNFASSARVISTCLKEKRLSGYALVIDGLICGYCFFFCDGEKGLIGDLFVDPAFAGMDQVLKLLEHANETLLATPGLRRIEAQIPHYTLDDLESNFTSWKYHGYRRRFMILSIEERPHTAALGAGDSPPAQLNPDEFRIMPWEKRYASEAAELVFGAYRHHIDAAINDQYSSLAGTTRLIDNIIHYQGCGEYLEQVSRVVIHRKTHKLAGVLAVTAVRSETAHVPQIAVTTTMQGIGLGTALLESAFDDLRKAGYKQVTLTVTDANTGAVRLYERLGFKTFRPFAAFVFNR